MKRNDMSMTILQLFSIFVFYEYEYIGIFVNIVKIQLIFFFSDVCEWEKLIFLEIKNNDQTRVWCVLYPNYVFKTTYQTLPNVKIIVFIFILYI